MARVHMGCVTQKLLGNVVTYRLVRDAWCHELHSQHTRTTSSITTLALASSSATRPQAGRGGGSCVSSSLVCARVHTEVVGEDDGSHGRFARAGLAHQENLEEDAQTHTHRRSAHREKVRKSATRTPAQHALSLFSPRHFERTFFFIAVASSLLAGDLLCFLVMDALKTCG